MKTSKVSPQTFYRIQYYGSYAFHTQKKNQPQYEVDQQKREIDQQLQKREIDQLQKIKDTSVYPPITGMIISKCILLMYTCTPSPSLK